MISWLLSTALAATWTVGPSQDAATISDAIALASDGDTIEIEAGTYTEYVHVDRDLTLRGDFNGVVITDPIGQPESGVVQVDPGVEATLHDLLVIGRDARALYVGDATVTIEYSTFSAQVVAEKGGVIFQQGGALDLNVVDLFGGTANKGGLVAVEDGALRIRDGTLRAGFASEEGGAVHAEGTDEVQIYNTTNLRENVAGIQGGALYLAAPQAVPDPPWTSYDILILGEYDENDAGSGGAIYMNLADGSATIRGFYRNNRAVDTGVGGALAIHNGAVALNNAIFSENEANEGGAVYLDDCEASAVALQFLNNEATSNGGGLRVVRGRFDGVELYFEGNTTGFAGGGLATSQETEVSLKRSIFCQNVSADYGGAIHMGVVNYSQALTLQNNIFLENQAVSRGGAVNATNLAASVDGNHFLANVARTGAAWSGTEAPLTFTHNLVAWHGPFAVDLGLGDAVLFRWNAWWENGVSALPSFVGEQDAVYEDPRLFQTPNGRCDISMRHSWYGALRGAGDPAQLNPLYDGNDETTDVYPPSQRDIGAFGGPDTWSWRDDDQDGSLWPWDCDDEADSVSETFDETVISHLADEVWYDGVDQNCDVWSDFDQDQDGYDAEEAGGTDCNDTDPTIYPGAPETAYDSIDQDCDDADLLDADGDGDPSIDHGGGDCNDDDPSIHSDVAVDDDPLVDRDCDGFVDYSEPFGPRSCASTGGSGSGGLLLALLISALRLRSSGHPRASRASAAD